MVVTFGLALWARSQAPRHPRCQIWWGQIQCVCVRLYEWVARDQNYPHSACGKTDWMYCVSEMTFALPEEFSASLSYCFASGVARRKWERDKDNEQLIKKETKETSGQVHGGHKNRRIKWRNIKHKFLLERISLFLILGSPFPNSQRRTKKHSENIFHCRIHFQATTLKKVCLTLILWR